MDSWTFAQVNLINYNDGRYELKKTEIKFNNCVNKIFAQVCASRVFKDIFFPACFSPELCLCRKKIKNYLYMSNLCISKLCILLCTQFKSHCLSIIITSSSPFCLLIQCSSGCGWPVTLQDTETRSPTFTLCWSSERNTSGDSVRKTSIIILLQYTL